MMIKQKYTVTVLGMALFAGCFLSKPVFQVSPPKPAASHTEGVPLYIVQQTTTTIAIDGDLNEWTAVTPMVLNDSSQAYEGWLGKADQTVSAYAIWDKKNLYLAFDISDNVLFIPPVASFEGDGIQVVMDPLNDKGRFLRPDDYNFIFGPSKKGKQAIRGSSPWNKPLGCVDFIKTAIKIRPDSSGYSCEIAIPFSELLPFSPGANTVCGIDFAIPDNDGQGFKGGLQWAKSLWGKKKPDQFGEFMFSCAHAPENNEIYLSSWNEYGLEDTTQFRGTVGMISTATGPGKLRAFVRQGSTSIKKLGTLVIDLDKGLNRFDLSWNASDLDIGRYDFMVTFKGDTAIYPFTKNRPVAVGRVLDSAAAGKGLDELEVLRSLARTNDLPLIARYKTTPQGDLNIHIFEPGQHGPATPAILFFCGGAFSTQSASIFYNHAKYFASRGMAAFVADYRVRSVHNTTPLESIKDARSAMRWIRRHASVLGVDTSMIAASGGSAGGNLAANLGIAIGYDEEGEDLAIPSCANAMVLFNPGTSISKGRIAIDEKPASAIDNIRPGLAPALVFHGTLDAAIPFSHAERFVRKMRDAGNRCDFVPFKNREHEFEFYIVDGDNKDFRETLYLMDEFLCSIGYVKGMPTVTRPVYTQDDYRM